MVFNSINNDSTETLIQEENLPKLSNNDISIITPENKTYTEMMSGYYPATYGFENEDVGNSDLEIDFVEAMIANGTTEVISEKDGHYNCLYLNADPGHNYNTVYNYFGQYLTSGTIELWHYPSPSGFDWTHKMTFTDYVTYAMLFGADGHYYWHIKDGGPKELVKENVSNIWNHIKFQWIGNDINIFIDGILEYSGHLGFGQTNVTRFGLQEYNGNESWYDAISYSWDPDYTVGDNANEGLLLSFENNINLNEIEYSLDGQESKTVLVNITIPMPEDGVHTLQVTGEDIDGIWYKSYIRYFTVYFPIDIITPEAKTYNKAMDGYYPATYGFENETTGELPSIPYSNTDGGTVKVIEEISGHKKVLELSDNNNSAGVSFNNIFSSPNGTIDFWFRTNDTSKDIWITFGGDSGTPLYAFIRILIENDIWRYTADTTKIDIPNVSPPQNNTWHRITIHFRCLGAPAYKNLNDNTWKCLIDGIDSGELLPRGDDENNMTSISFRTLDAFEDYSIFIDAIGYSWDPGYNIGDNAQEGLLLSYENSTALNWTGYTLDGSANRTIWGNTSIPLPHDASHVIRVFGNDTDGTIYESNIRRFSIHHINIITPEEKIYNEPMSGYYPATYGFEETRNNYDPPNWTDTLDNWRVIEEFNGHQKVFNCYEDRTNTIQNWTAGPQDNGTVEFWVANEDTASASHSFQCRISGNNEVCTLAVGASGNFSYQDSTGFHILKVPVINDQWYHIRIDFETTLGGYQGLGQYMYYLYINQIQYGPFSFRFNQTPYRFHCWSNIFSHNRYLDAIGYSWDPNYNIGDNLNEGLLLSYINSTALNWKGYSFDYQQIRTVLGNNTIPIPLEGFHRIQVFGNNSMGNFYQSEVRNFAVFYDFTAPEIIVNSPNSNDLFGGASPEFNITVIEQNLDKMWYTIDAGLINITIPEPTGMINQLKWNDRENGTVNIRFYARDILGYIGFEQVSIRKDTLPPEITINSPNQNQIFRDHGPSFDISINEGNLDEIWYTLDDGLVNITCTTSGQIIQQYWNALSPGDYILKFYANDTLGNSGFSEVSIKKREQVISVYNPIILSLISITGFALIIRKIKKKLEQNKYKV